MSISVTSYHTTYTAVKPLVRIIVIFFDWVRRGVDYMIWLDTWTYYFKLGHYLSARIIDKSPFPFSSQLRSVYNPSMEIGLCALCHHVKTLASSRGSVFYMCMKAETDPKFRRYPALPVLECSGYEKIDETSLGETQ